MSLEKDFDRAVRSIMTSNISVSLQNKLNLYGLFNQAKRGNCPASPPHKATDVLSQQKFLAWKSKSGLSKPEAMTQYVALVGKLLNTSRTSSKSMFKPPPLPPLLSLSKRNKKTEDTEDEKLPTVLKTSSAELSKETREEMFRSRHFSSVAGLQNPLANKQDIVERYEVYERVRKFYTKYDPKRLNRGIGAIVEWTLENGITKLNSNLRKKYNADLDSFEQLETKTIQKLKKEDQQRRSSQIALSRRLLVNSDQETRQKLDKLTRFLLVNDPELVSRGMYLLIRFIEAKGVGALNENLKQNYGKSLDMVTDEELNAELKKKYGNDLEMLEKPLFGELSEEEQKKLKEENNSDVKSVQETLKQQIMKLDKEKLRSTQVGNSNFTNNSNSSTNTKTTRDTSKSQNNNSNNSGNNTRNAVQKTLAKIKQTVSRRSKKQPENNADNNADAVFGTEFNIKTLDLQDSVHLQQFEARLKKFLTRFEPKRFETALELMTEFTKKEGVSKLNEKLRKKYGVDLKSFDKIPVGENDDLSEEEFSLRLMQFVNKHEEARNISKALKAMTAYKNKYGLQCLNTKLYMKYGETLNDFGSTVEVNENEDNMKKVGDDKERGVSIAEMHTTELSDTLLEKLRSFYAKYEPMVLAANGVDRIFKWAERNGEEALDRQLKAKYSESLSEYIAYEAALNTELKDFYAVTDKNKLITGYESVLAWAVINGRDALNFNLRRKYNRDLDSAKGVNVKYYANEVPDV